MRATDGLATAEVLERYGVPQPIGVPARNRARELPASPLDLEPGSPEWIYERDRFLSAIWARRVVRHGWRHSWRFPEVLDAPDARPRVEPESQCPELMVRRPPLGSPEKPKAATSRSPRWWVRRPSFPRSQIGLTWPPAYRRGRGFARSPRLCRYQAQPRGS
jgi:hypothetical protein